MATKLLVAGDAIVVNKLFVSGRDRITINGNVVFEGKLEHDSPEQVIVGNRQYTLTTAMVSKLTGATSISLQVSEDGQLIHDCLYDQIGNPVGDSEQAKSNVAIQTSTGIGVAIGVGALTALQQFGAPGGIVGGALGGLIGGGLGYGIGLLLFRRNKNP